MAPLDETAPAVAFAGVVKSFGAVRALDGVDLAFTKASIHALLGENGAGKTTLMRILYGLAQPDAGSLAIDGTPVRFASPAEAIAAGVGMVSQHFELVPSLSVRENLLIGQAGSHVEARRRVDSTLARLRADHGLDLHGPEPVDRLSIGVRQRIEIAKALVRDPRILILDEPTALLGPHDVTSLFAMLRGFRTRGMTIILISHKLNEIRQVADRISVMRHGQVVLADAGPDTDETVLATAMIGRRPRPMQPPSPRLRGAAVMSTRRLHSDQIGPIDLDLHAGEIVGVAGVAGNGQSALLDVLAGIAPAAGSLYWKQVPVPASKRAWNLRRLGLAHIPEDRLGCGLLPHLPVWRNLLLGRSAGTLGNGWLSVKKLRREAAARMAEWDLRPADPDMPAGLLSGGNQQKLVCAREFSHSPAVVLAGHPTRGVDLGTAETIYQRIRELSESGSAVLLVSFDLDELLALADRIIVMVAGRIAGEIVGHDATPARLGRLMAGLEAG